MRIAFFDTHKFELNFFQAENEKFNFDIQYLEPRLTGQTMDLAKDHDVVCCFVNDILDSQTLRGLGDLGIRLVALRCAGFNNVDLAAAKENGIRIVRVPEYSPYAVAEHAVALILTLNRKVHRAYHRVRDLNFSLDGLVGFDLHGKTVGVLGTGKIGSVFSKIMSGFGCKVLAHDLKRNAELEDKYGVVYTDLKSIYNNSHIISLHLPLTPKTRHIISQGAFAQIRPGCMLINTGRGALVDTKALLDNLKNGRLGYAGLDVYEEEEEVFFRDLSEQILRDDCLARLLTFPNVLITSHQAFLTGEALQNICATTLSNIERFKKGEALSNEVSFEKNMKNI